MKIIYLSLKNSPNWIVVPIALVKQENPQDSVYEHEKSNKRIWEVEN
jgi:hypothetical protein